MTQCIGNECIARTVLALSKNKKFSASGYHCGFSEIADPTGGAPPDTATSGDPATIHSVLHI